MMRDKKLKIISGVMALVILLPVLYQIIFKDGRKGYVDELIHGVETEKTMTAYNKAYLTIKNLDDEPLKDEYLDKLTDYKEACTTDEVRSVMKDIEELEDTGDVEKYNYLLFERLENLEDPRNGYYYRYEISQRSDNLFTKDFTRAQDGVNVATADLNLLNLQYAKQSVAYVKNEKNKQYLQDAINVLEEDYNETLKIYDIKFVNDTELRIRLTEPLKIDSINKSDFTIEDTNVTRVELTNDNEEIIVNFKSFEEKQDSVELKISSMELTDRNTKSSHHLVYKPHETEKFE